MIKCAFFPTLPATLPVVRYIMDGCTEYKITTLLSFPGSGLIGEDGGFADYRERLGLCVQEEIEKDSHLWDCLLVADHQDVLNKEKNDEYTKQLVLAAIRLQKRVVCSKRLTTEERESFERIAAANNCGFMYLPAQVPPMPSKPAGALERLHSFYILFGSIVSDPISMGTCLKCVEQLSQKYRVIVFSTDENSLLCETKTLYPILYSSASEVEKVYAVNRFLADIERRSHPEIVILHISEPVLPFDDTVPNGFGILPFMLAKSIPTNLFSCIIPFIYYSVEFAENLSEGIFRQNGYPVDGISISNLLIDSSSAVDKERVSIVYVKNEVVENYSNPVHPVDSIPVYNTFSHDEMTRLALDIEDAYLQFASTRVIP